ncbi:putative cytochrome P450 [Rosa chinensis]|uniref:Putative cytochrome P450 n=1 Tax=Rosa chinensis TaxID=74649 RepID=A0A2P6RLX4_ROSCH|nr:putative cytochrome P450 [Rosa chinensis]
MDSLMQAPFILFLIIIPLTILLGLVLSALLPQQKLSYPPGPKGLPIIGNMRIMDQLTHRGLAKLANLYSGILHLRMGFLHMVVVSSADVARQVLQVQDITFSNRPATVAIRYLTYDRADLAFAHYGPFWRQMRKLSIVKLFSRKRAESWESVRDEVDSAVRVVSARAGTAVNIGEVVFSMTKSIIYRAAFGSSSKEGQDEFIAIMREVSELFGAFNIADFFPWLGWLDPQGIKPRLVKSRKSLDKFIDNIIDDHIQNSKGEGDETDIVDDLLAFNRDQATGKESAILLTRDNIKAIILRSTVASTIEWAITELMRNPEELKKVQQELVDVVGFDRRLQESDVENLTYLKCALKETLRLHPPVPLLLHETAEDTEVSGYHIPKKSHVMINVWAIGRDKDFWDEPETFMPSRFLKEGMPDFKGSGNFDYIPFGSGRRSCPGMQLGRHMLELSVGHLLHCFTWELDNAGSGIDMTDVFGLTTPRASRLVAVPNKRVTMSL